MISLNKNVSSIIAISTIFFLASLTVIYYFNFRANEIAEAYLGVNGDPLVSYERRMKKQKEKEAKIKAADTTDAADVSAGNDSSTNSAELLP